MTTGVCGPAFVETFSTPSRHYVYDVGSNLIFEVDRATADLVTIWQGEGSVEALPADIRNRHPTSELQSALRELRRWRKRGYLSVRRPSRFAFPLGDAQIQERLAQHVEQMILGVTEECNLRCRYCVYSGSYPKFRLHRPRRMSVHTARAAIDFYFAHSGEREELLLSFYGGEPLLRLPLLRSAVAHAEAHRGAHRIRYNINTNGMALTDGAADFLEAHNFALRVSLDGPRSLNDANRIDASGRGSFDRVIGRLKRLKDRHPRYFETCVSFISVIGWPYDVVGAKRFFETEPLLRDANVEVSSVLPLETRYLDTYPQPREHHGYAEMEDAYVEEMAANGRASPFLAGLFDRTMIRIASRPMDEPLDEIDYPNGTCLPGARRVFVDATGRFQPCERFNDTISIGDLSHGFDMRAIGQLMDQYVETCNTSCGGCWARRLCSACPVSANGEGIDSAFKADFCNLERKHIHSSLRLYMKILERSADAMDQLLAVGEPA